MSTNKIKKTYDKLLDTLNNTKQCVIDVIHESIGLNAHINIHHNRLEIYSIMSGFTGITVEYYYEDNKPTRIQFDAGYVTESDTTYFDKITYFINNMAMLESHLIGIHDTINQLNAVEQQLAEYI